jgi:hypothetical protein
MRSNMDDFPHSSELFEIKNWWDSIIDKEGSFSSYAFFLTLPSNDKLAEYVSEHRGELDAFSADNCLLLMINEKMVQRIGSNPKLPSMESLGEKNKKINVAYFRELLKDKVSEGYSVRMANFLKVPFSAFPCLVFFQGVFSQEHIIISFSGMNKEEIGERMGELFSAIQKAASADKPILKELEQLRKKELFQKDGKAIISARRNIAGKTFQTAIEVWIKFLLGSR